MAFPLVNPVSMLIVRTMQSEQTFSLNTRLRRTLLVENAKRIVKRVSRQAENAEIAMILWKLGCIVSTNPLMMAPASVAEDICEI